MENIEKLIQLFKEIYPDFRTFQEYGKGFADGEVLYKREASARMHELLDRWVAGDEPDFNPEEFTRRLRRILMDKLEIAGLVQNLTGWRDHRYLFNDIFKNDEDIQAFASQLKILLQSASSDFDGPLEQLLSWMDGKDCSANITKAIPTVLLFLWDQEHHIFIKPDIFDRFLRGVGEKHLGRGKSLTVNEYHRVLDVMNDLSADLADLAPRDMLDLQSFYYTVANDNVRVRFDKVIGQGSPTADPVPFDKTPEGEELVDEQAGQIFRILKRTSQVILTGPPGTGKTFLATQIVHHIWKENQKERINALWDEFYEVTKPFALAIALGMERMSLPAEPREIGKSRIVTRWLERHREVQKRNRLPRMRDEMQAHVSPDSEKVNVDRPRRTPHIFDNEGEANWILSKEAKITDFDNAEKARLVLEKLKKLEDPHRADAWRTVSVVNFHPSMNYEDFVEGLRPVIADDHRDSAKGSETVGDSGTDGATGGGSEQGGIRYRLVKGAFRKSVDAAFADPDNLHLLVIDEINRGNLSRIFGELISILENSKRARVVPLDEVGDVQPHLALSVRTVENESLRRRWRLDQKSIPVSLAYSGAPLVVPENLLILGTMNTADRSIALMDFALRRRFHFHYCAPDMSIVTKVAASRGKRDLAREFEKPIGLFKKLNERVEYLKDREHVIGHSYLLEAFERCVDDPELEVEVAVGEILQQQVIPLLWEYFFSDWRSLAILVGGKLVQEVPAPFDDEEEDEYGEKRRRLKSESLEPADVYQKLLNHLLSNENMAKKETLEPDGEEGQALKTKEANGD